MLLSTKRLYILPLLINCYLPYVFTNLLQIVSVHRNDHHIIPICFYVNQRSTRSYSKRALMWFICWSSCLFLDHKMTEIYEQYFVFKFNLGEGLVNQIRSERTIFGNLKVLYPLKCKIQPIKLRLLYFKILKPK